MSIPLFILPPTYFWCYIAGEYLRLNDIAVFEVALSKKYLQQYQPIDVIKYNTDTNREESFDYAKLKWALERSIYFQSLTYVDSTINLTNLLNRYTSIFYICKISIKRAYLTELISILSHFPNLSILDLTVIDSDNISSDLLVDIARICKNITEISIRHCGQIRKFNFVHHIAKLWPQLKKIDVDNCIVDSFHPVHKLSFRSLESIFLVGHHDIGRAMDFEVSIAWIFHVFPNLRHISLGSPIRSDTVIRISNTYKQLESFKFFSIGDESVLMHLSKNCIHLKTLEIADSCLFANLHSYQPLLFPALTKLSVMKNPFRLSSYSCDFLHSLLRGCPSLTSLQVDGCDVFSDESFDLNSSRFCRNLQSLILHSNFGVTDKTLSRISQQCVNVIHLELSVECETYAGMKALASGCIHLETLIVSSSNVSSLLSFIYHGHRCLRSLKIHSNSYRIICADIVEPVGQCPRLVALSFTGIGFFEVPELTKIGSCCPNIRTLSISNQVRMETVSTILNSFINLEHIDIWIDRMEMVRPIFHHGHLKIRTMNFINERIDINAIRPCQHPMKYDKNRIIDSMKFPSLYRVSLKCTDVLDDDIKALAMTSPNINHINLSSCKFITSKSLVSLATYCNALDAINVGGCPKICSMGVKRLLERFPRIRFLDLTNCRKLLKEMKQSLNQTIETNQSRRTLTPT